MKLGTSIIGLWIISVIIASITYGGEGGVITFMLGGLFALMAYLGLKAFLVQHNIDKRFDSYIQQKNMQLEEMDWSQSIILQLFHSKKNVFIKTYSNNSESVLKITEFIHSGGRTYRAHYHGFMKRINIKKRLLVTQSFMQKLKNFTSLEQVDVSSFEKLKNYSVTGDIFDLQPLEKVIPESIPSDMIIACEDGFVLVFRKTANMRNNDEDFKEMKNLVEQIAKAYKKN